MNVLNVLMDNLHSIYGHPRRALGPEIDDSTLSFVNGARLHDNVRARSNFGGRISTIRVARSPLLTRIQCRHRAR